MVAPIEFTGNPVQVRYPGQCDRLRPSFRPIGGRGAGAANPGQQKYAGCGDDRAPGYLAPGPNLAAQRHVSRACLRARPTPRPKSHAGPFLLALGYLSGSIVIMRTPCQPICGWPSQVEVARRQSDKGGKILDFYFLLRYCLADTLQIVKILDGIDLLDLLRLDVRQP